MATETVKKTKAPAKSKSAKTQGETEGAVKAAPAAGTKKTVKAAPKAKAVEAVVAVPTHAEIAVLAQKYWAERGWQDGFAEQDWLRAERELLGLAS
jgi:hypothetical protein